MAQVQTNTESGEMTQRFIEFVMMQAQHAALFMGQSPDPRGGPEMNLELAKMFIDQLAMIREKTRGNLSSEELQMLNGAISNLQLTFVEVSRVHGNGTPAGAPVASAVEPAAPEQKEQPTPEAPAAPATPPSVEEGRKKFTKSYGA